METIDRFLTHVIEVGRFVVDHIGTIDIRDDGFIISSVGTKSVFLPPLRCGCNAVIPDHLSAWRDVVPAILQTRVKAYRNICLSYFIDQEFSFAFFFFKKKTITFDAMCCRKTADLNSFIVYKYFWF